MKEIIINGNFMSRRVTGVERYARKITFALDKLLKQENVTLVIPSQAKDVPCYKNIKVQQEGVRGGILWEQTYLRRYLRAHKNAVCINFANVTPLFVQPGITVIHDIMYKVRASYYHTTLRNRLSSYWHVFQYWYVTRHERNIITVSNFSKSDIEKNYPEARGKIKVIPNAWQHVLTYKASEDWQAQYPFLKDGKFFFSMATLAKNKNRRWIIETAKRNPDSVFAISGMKYDHEHKEVPANVHMLGYISDEDACALIKHCRAFLFPSLYEGFGLPPLEALALGTEVISSNAASLPEVLGDCVHYIDPMNYDVDLDKLLGEKVSDRHIALDKYSWEKSAALLYDLICSVIRGE